MEIGKPFEREAFLHGEVAHLADVNASPLVESNATERRQAQEWTAKSE